MNGAPGAGAGTAAGPSDDVRLCIEWAGGLSPGSEESEKSEGDPEALGAAGAPDDALPGPEAWDVPDVPPPPPLPALFSEASEFSELPEFSDFSDFSDAFCVYQAGGA
jgi:hypothetical protein